MQPVRLLQSSWPARSPELHPSTPTLVLWDVEPSSGPAPYVLKAGFSDREKIDGVTYALQVVYTYQPGSCKQPGFSDAPLPAVAEALLTNGEYTFEGDVGAGQCYSISGFIYQVSDGTIVSSMTTEINNI